MNINFHVLKKGACFYGSQHIETVSYTLNNINNKFNLSEIGKYHKKYMSLESHSTGQFNITFCTCVSVKSTRREQRATPKSI